MDRNTALNVVKAVILGAGYTNTIIASKVSDGRLRSDRKPVFYIMPNDGTHLPEHSSLEDYSIDIVVGVERHNDPYGEASLIECNRYLKELVLLFELLGEDNNIPLVAYVTNTVSPKQFADDVYIHIGIVRVAVSSYEGD